MSESRKGQEQAFQLPSPQETVERLGQVLRTMTLLQQSRRDLHEEVTQQSSGARAAGFGDMAYLIKALAIGKEAGYRPGQPVGFTDNELVGALADNDEREVLSRTVTRLQADDTSNNIQAQATELRSGAHSARNEGRQRIATIFESIAAGIDGDLTSLERALSRE